MESVCRDSQKMYDIINTLESIPDSPQQLEIGSDLALLLCLSAETQDDWGAALDILDEIKPLVEKHCDADTFAVLLILESTANLEIYKIRRDVAYLIAAKSNLADLRRLSTEGTLTEETLKIIEDLETDIDAQ